MKSQGVGGVAGNVNLRGKKCKMLSCRCCDVINLKDDYLKKLFEKEIKNYKLGEDDERQ